MGAEPAKQGRKIGEGIDEAIEAVAKHGRKPRKIYLTPEDYDRFEAEALDAWRDAHPGDGTAYVSITEYRDVPVRVGKRSLLFSDVGVSYGITRRHRPRPSTL